MLRVKLTELCDHVGAAQDAGLEHDVADIVDDVGVVAEARRSSCRRRRRH